MKPRILFVDDDPALLAGLAATFRKVFDVVTALSGAAGIAILTADPTFAVVVSDMRMPEMDGAAFLSHAATLAPATVRMLLSGQADLESAAAAVNRGSIFRFLMKPCPREELRGHLEQAIEHHRLIGAERELLEQTLRGSIAMLVDILALTNPVAFGRANRIKALVVELGAALGVIDGWQLEIAALASQLGNIALPAELCMKLERGHTLSADEQAMVARAPTRTAQLLANIPRLEGVRDILSHHVVPLARTPGASPRQRTLELGAHLIRFALDVDAMQVGTYQPSPAEIRARIPCDPEIAAAFARVRAGVPIEARALALGHLKPGMILAEDVRLATGALLVARGYQITPSFIDRIQNFPEGALGATISVMG